MFNTKIIKETHYHVFHRKKSDTLRLLFKNS